MKRFVVVVMAALGARGALAQDAAPPAADTPPTTIDVPSEPQSPTDIVEGKSPNDTKPVVRREQQIGNVQSGKGRGFPLSADGRSRLHLSLDAGTGFDTNPYAVPLENALFAGDVIARIRPGASVEYPGSLLAFDANAYIDYGFLPGLITPQTQTFLLYQSLLSADLQLNRGGQFNAAVGDSVSWNSDPAQVVIGELFNRIQNNFRAGVGWRPGGGTLQLKAAYGFDFTKWIDVTGGPPGPIANGVFDQMIHSLTVRGDYRFLPKTGAFVSTSVGWSVFPFTNLQPMAFPVSLSVGAMGQVTPKVTGLVSVGYANPLVWDDNPQGSGNYGIQTGLFLGIIGQAEVRWVIGPTTRIGGGFQRAVNPAPLYQFLVNNRFYLGFDQLVGDKLSLGLNLGYSILQFGVEQPILVSGFVTDRNIGDRLDGHLDGRIAVMYNVFDWLAFGITNITDWRATNAGSLTASGDTVNLGFFRNQTLLQGSVRY